MPLELLVFVGSDVEVSFTVNFKSLTTVARWVSVLAVLLIGAVFSSVLLWRLLQTILYNSRETRRDKDSVAPGSEQSARVQQERTGRDRYCSTSLSGFLR